MKKVMVFGTFDGFHEGHRFFLEKASELGDLIVVVAEDEHVLKIKGKKPKFQLEDRIAEVKRQFENATVIAGDKILNTWEVIGEHGPEIVALGYDQRELAASLFKSLSTFPRRPEIKIIAPFKPEEFKSSKLNQT